MSRELLILRHGKSDWTTGTDDFNRPLKKRGKRNALRMGLWMQEQDLVPDYILSSPALRALKTAEKVCQVQQRQHKDIHLDGRIYEAGLNSLLEVLHDVPDTAQRVLLIGHNPGLEYLLISLVKSTLAIPEDGKLLPTAALAHLSINTSWGSIDENTARLSSLTRVKSLPEISLKIDKKHSNFEDQEEYPEPLLRRTGA